MLQMEIKMDIVWVKIIQNNKVNSLNVRYGYVSNHNGHLGLWIL